MQTEINEHNYSDFRGVRRKKFFTRFLILSSTFLIVGISLYLGLKTFRQTNKSAAEKIPGLYQQIKPQKDISSNSDENSPINLTAEVISLQNAVELYQKNFGIKLSIIRSSDQLDKSGLKYNGWVEPTTNNDDTVLAVTVAIYKEWQKYPAGFLQKVGLKQVAVVGKINNSGNNVAAMPRAEDKDVMYFSTLFGTDSYIKRVAHHELDHLIEYNAHGSYYYADPGYASCNKPGFVYGTGGLAAYSGTGLNSYTRHPVEGLIDGYATYGIEEDKAQIYTELFSNIGFLNDLAKTDTSLTCKKQNYLSFLQKFDGSITEEYLKKLPIIPTLMR